jgi:2-octaprenyl-6-methoxyphenol hydroxylase
LFLHFDHRELGANTGPFGWMVEARSLRVALNAVPHDLPQLTVCAPSRASVHRTARGCSVQLDNGAIIVCRLIIAAEGRTSPLRDDADILVTRLPYRQTSIVLAISHERPHNNNALEHFLPTGPFAQLPMSASRDAEGGGAANISAIVWTERADLAERIVTFDDDRLAREIARRLGDHLGRVRPIGRRWIYPLSAMIAHRYTDTRLAVVGDAAHGIHPIAGQGLNLGFRDAIALADLLIEAHRAGADLGAPELLASYQRRRRADNLAMLMLTDALDRLFSNDTRVLRLARDLGIAAVHRMPPLKRLFMRQAMGTGALPGLV